MNLHPYMAYPYSDNEFSFGVNLLLVKFVPKYAPYLTLAGAPAGGIRLVGCYPRGVSWETLIPKFKGLG